MHPLITETVAAEITAERRRFAAHARRYSVRRPRFLAGRRTGAHPALTASPFRTGALR
jgi:hypothetical protein